MADIPAAEPWSSDDEFGIEEGFSTVLLRKLSKLLSKAFRNDEAGGVLVLVFCCIPNLGDGASNF